MQEENLENNNKNFAKGLFEFLKEYSVIGLAIGVIVAQISKDLIDSIVKGIFTPLISLIILGGSFQNLSFYIKDAKFDVGLIISNFLTFIIVLTILYILIKKILKKEKLLKKK